MKIKIKIFINFLFLFIVLNSVLLSQGTIKKGLKFGIELQNYLSQNTGAFPKSFDYFFSLFTGIKLYSSPEGSILLRVEANYVQSKYFKLGRHMSGVVDTSDVNWNGLNYSVFDEKHWLRIIELGLIPEYHLQLAEKVFLELFLGPSIGFGGEGFDINQLDKNTFYNDLYDMTTRSLSAPISLNLGISLYYLYFAFDIRYRYTDAGTEYNNVYFQAGLAF